MATGLTQLKQGNMDLQSQSSISESIEWKHGQLNFYLAQILIHQTYTTYLYKYGHDEDEVCPECYNESNMADHAFFTCPRYVDQRNCQERTMESR